MSLATCGASPYCHANVAQLWSSLSRTRGFTILWRYGVCRSCAKEHQAVTDPRVSTTPSRPFHQKRPDVHEIVLSIKSRFPCPRKSVNFEDFILISTVFPYFGPFSGGGGGKPTFADKNFIDPQTFLISEEFQFLGVCVSLVQRAANLSKFTPTCARRPKRPKQTCVNSRPHALVYKPRTGTTQTRTPSWKTPQQRTS